MEILLFTFGILLTINIMFLLAITVCLDKIVKQKQQIEKLNNNVKDVHQQISCEVQNIHRKIDHLNQIIYNESIGKKLIKG